jgi:PqqD family protein of HPr-rel-A system
MPAETRYRAAAAGDLVRVELDALTAVYDRRSGQTHLLASPLPEMLEALAEGEWTVDAFADHLAASFQVAGEGDAHALIAAHLDELATLGLVEAR